MMIKVMHEDGRTEMVLQEDLEAMIEKHTIIKFKRAGEWVDVDHDLLRRMCSPEYFDDERKDSPLYH